jgi:alkanesulfonate monooxygenase SsuD/methylene tetrahydromethanopterin reductase-like flavin-dependent oxidoreductase (luciferase family)
MKFGFVIPGGDVPEFVEMAVEIERAGWDAVFGWEAVYAMDPWVLLGAVAAKTNRVRLGSLLTPPSRRRPWKLASELATLDRLSGGRAVLTVGLGALETGFARVGEVTDRKTRAELLDEALDLMTLFWKSEPFDYQGKHYQVSWDSSLWKLEPIQEPRVPIWVAAVWPNERSMSRAARWDGAVPAYRLPSGEFVQFTPEAIRELRSFVEDRRGSADGFDIVVDGVTPAGDEAALERVRGLGDAGATWWIEAMWEAPCGLEAVRERIKAGPPDI